MVRIIDGVLYDTDRSEFLCSYNGYRGGFSSKYKRSSSAANYYIAKNAVIFCVTSNEINLKIEEPILKKIKERMNPTVYAKYWPVIIPGEGQMMTKEEKKRAPQKKLEDVE